MHYSHSVKYLLRIATEGRETSDFGNGDEKKFYHHDVIVLDKIYGKSNKRSQYYNIS